MALTEVRKGIYTNSGNGISGKEGPILLVHPFYGEPAGPSDKWKQYLARIGSLCSRSRPLIVMEEWHQFDRTVERLRDLGRVNGTYFIGLSCTGWYPKDIGWKDVADFLAYFEGEPLTCGGGYYTQDGPGGCLNNAVKEISKSRPDMKIEVMGEATF